MTNKKIKEFRNNLPERKFPESLNDLVQVIAILCYNMRRMKEEMKKPNPSGPLSAMYQFWLSGITDPALPYSELLHAHHDIFNDILLDMDNAYLKIDSLNSLYLFNEIYLTNENERFCILVKGPNITLKSDNKLIISSITEFVTLLNESFFKENIKSILLNRKENGEEKKVECYSLKEFRRKIKKGNSGYVLDIEVDESIKTYFETLTLINQGGE